MGERRYHSRAGEVVEVDCQICGENFRNPTEDELLTHAWLRHPIEFFSSGRVVAMLSRAARKAGETAAEMLKGLR